MRYQYYISDSNNPYLNLSTEQSLMETVSDEALIYLWQNDDTIVVGRNQDVYRECDADAFQKSGGRIARRRSGGGAVYHDLGNLNVSLIARQEASEKLNLYRLICDTLLLLGVSAIYNQRNDVLVHGKKVSGSAEFVSNGVVCMHGTILINTDVARMQKFLTPGREKLARNSVESVSSRVINLNELASISVPMVVEAIIDISKANEYKKYLINPDKYYSFYSDSEWIMEGVGK